MERVTISQTRLTLQLRRDFLLTSDMRPQPETREELKHFVTLNYPLQMKRRGVETKLIIGRQAPGEPDPELVKLLAMARDCYEGLKSGRYKSQLQIRSECGLDKADVSRILNLAFLSPKIVGEIISGKQPVDMTAQSLKISAGRLPTCWNDQANLLGIAI